MNDFKSYLEKPRTAACLLLLLCAIVFFTGLGSYPFTDRDEGLYATVALNMERSGDIFIPEINGKKFLDKPILAFWLSGFFQKILGSNEFSLRAGSAFSAVLLLCFMFMFIYKISGNVLTSSLIIISTAFSPIFAVVAKTFLVDMPLVLFTTVSLLGFFIATEKDSKTWPWYLIFWTGLSLGFLTKGPVAPAVIIPSALIYAFSQRKTLSVLKKSLIPAGIVIFLILNFWYFVVYLKMGDAFINDFFMKQILKRGTKSLVGHAGIPFYYFLIIMLFTYPFFPSSLAGFIDAAERWMKGKLSTPLERLIFFSAIIVAAVVAVFTVAATKLPHYILPAVPFLGILSGYYLSLLFNRTKTSNISTHAFMGLHIVLSLAFIIAAVILYFMLPSSWEYMVKNLVPDKNEYALPAAPPSALLSSLAIILTGLAAFAAVTVFRRKMPERMVMLVCFSGLFICTAGFFSAAYTIRHIQQPAKDMALDLKRRISGGEFIAAYGLWKPCLFYYVGKEMKRYRFDSADDNDEFIELLKTDKKIFILTRTRFKDKLATIPGFVELSQHGPYMLGGNSKAVTPAGK